MRHTMPIEDPNAEAVDGDTMTRNTERDPTPGRVIVVDDSPRT